MTTAMATHSPKRSGRRASFGSVTYASAATRKYVATASVSGLGAK